MPPKKKAKTADAQHPIDASGVLQAVKEGSWSKFAALLKSQKKLSFEDFNSLPPGRNFGVLHQLAFHGNRDALEALLTAHPRVDLKLLTKDGKTAEEVAVEEGGDASFRGFLRECVRRQSVQELVSAARDGEWKEFDALLASSGVGAAELNTVPTGRSWGVIHQVSYYGEEGVLQSLVAAHPTLDLELETNEDAPQTPLDIAQGRGHTTYRTTLQGLLASSQAMQHMTSGGGSSASSAVHAASAAMKVPVEAGNKLCNICFMNEHDAGTKGVACDEDHFICQECFSSYVASESDTQGNPQSVVLNGGRILCPQKKASSCGSGAFANKLIAMIVPDELYEKYLQARDFVVGKEAVAGALAKVKDSGALGAVEQEQIRNLYKKPDGSYAAYQCKKCKFGPIDHGHCADLSAHHGEHKGGGSVINNGCPKCKWFAKNISEWPPWNGQFLKGAGGSSSSAT